MKPIRLLYEPKKTFSFFSKDLFSSGPEYTKHYRISKPGYKKQFECYCLPPLNFFVNVLSKQQCFRFLHRHRSIDIPHSDGSVLPLLNPAVINHNINRRTMMEYDCICYLLNGINNAFVYPMFCSAVASLKSNV